jgi:elongation factor 1-gamma
MLLFVVRRKSEKKAIIFFVFPFSSSFHSTLLFFRSLITCHLSFLFNVIVLSLLSQIKVFTERKDLLVRRIQAAARYSGASVEVIEQASAASKAPIGKLPIAETKEGLLFEANAMTRFVARQGKSQLFGASLFEESLVEQWIDFSVHEIELPASVWVWPIQGRIPNNTAFVERAKADIRKVFDILEKHLQTRTYLVGHRVTWPH